VHRLAAAGGEELVHLGCTDSAGQELVAEGTAAPDCFELELGGIGGGSPSHSASGSTTLGLPAFLLISRGERH
jgi:hypothetical protein